MDSGRNENARAKERMLLHVVLKFMSTPDPLQDHLASPTLSPTTDANLGDGRLMS
jgi:hypothetical protein